MKKTILFLMLTFSLFLVGCNSKEATEAAGNGQPEDEKVEFPTKPIELVVPWAAGGGTDLIARILAEAVEEYLPNKQPVVVINNTGGGGVVGTTDISNAEPDGYKLLITATAPIVVQPHLGNASYVPDDFQPIIQVQSTPLVLLVSEDAPWEDFDDWLEYVKDNPGEFTYGVPGAGTTSHLAMEALSFAAGIQTEVIPFEGNNPAITGLLGGHVHGAVVAAPDAESHINQGTVRPLVYLGSKKHKSDLDAPLAKEKNINVEVDVNTGILAPKGLPEDILAILQDAFKKALEDPTVIEKFSNIGTEPVYRGAEDFKAVISNEYDVLGEVIKNIDLSN